MRYDRTCAALMLAGLGAAIAGAPGAVRADVTIDEQTTFDFAIIRVIRQPPLGHNVLDEEFSD